ncbi:MAG: pyridoxamine 5'-phosphate oxidase family protein [Proteobacteria bacterium]|nr:pyridoxamine 5'-phosphate oxidase family protein [Pseudomonadota bacterium]
MLKKTERTKIARKPDRGRYDRETVHAIIDEALYCHVGIVVNERPVVIPTAHWRQGDRLYMHGSGVSRLIEVMAAGADICVTVTLLDGLVLARSGFHHSMNYRSVVIFGQAAPIEGREAKLAAMRAFMERIAPGRWDELRPPTEKEIAATGIVALMLDEASAKVRAGPPADDEADYAHPVWAGVVPVAERLGEPVPDPRLAPGIALPAYLGRLAGAKG